MGILDSITSSALAEAQEAQTEEAQLEKAGGFKDNEFKLDKGKQAWIEILPGDATWGRASGAALDPGVTNAEVKQWITEQLTKQLEDLGFNPGQDAVPSWALRPTTFPGHVVISSMFLGAKGVPNSGQVSFDEYPAKVLAKLPAEHPRVVASKLPNRFGKPALSTYIYLNVMEVSVSPKGVVDTADYESRVKAGGFVKVLKLSGAQYAKLREQRDAIAQMGIPGLTSVRILVKKGTEATDGYSFTPNTSTPPMWRKPEYMPLVLQELDTIGSLRERSRVRDLDDDEFASLVKATVDATPAASGPAA